MPGTTAGDGQMMLAEALPEFAAELQALLRLAGEHEFGKGVPALRIVSRCQCGDDFCASFYTAPPPRGAYGPGHRTIVLEPEHGMIILDVVGREIVHVEVLYRDEVRSRLARILATT